VILFLWACTNDPSKVAVTTTIGADRGEDPKGVAAGAEIDVYNASTEAFSHATADDQGKVTLDLPFGGASFMIVHADGDVPTSFSLGPFYEDSTLPDSVLWTRSEGSYAAIEEAFGPSCPNMEKSDDGVLLEGEVRLFIDGQDLDTLPLVTTANVTAYDSQDGAYEGCYLDDKGKPSSSATVTGQTGRFAIFGAGAGTLFLEVSFDLAEGIDEPPNGYYVVAEAGGAAPFYPALVFSPL
jgi:hypothetical protein